MSFRYDENSEREKRGEELVREVIDKSAEIHKREYLQTGRPRTDYFTAEDHPRFQRISGHGNRR